MPHDSWRDAVAEIRDATSTITSKQKEIARIAGIELSDSLPRLVAAARRQGALCTELGLLESTPAIDVQLEIIENVRTDEDIAPTPPDRREGDAWIQFFRLKARKRALERLEIGAGDIVKTTGSGGEFVAEVSSIGGTGRIYFKGGMGMGAWPDLVTVCCKNGDNSGAAQEVRKVAANLRASRARTDRWSLGKQAELQEFEVEGSLHSDDLEELQEIIDAADDEKPVQQLLETRPQLLTSLLGGRVRVCLPHPRLGGERVPDFLIADVDSLGIRWVLVELKTPTSDVTLRNDNLLDRHARKGVSQVKEWREWLQNNLDYARRSKRSNGLGLTDIRPGSEGLVLVGRRARLHDNAAAVRHPILEQNHIRVHTYDWLIERLGGLLAFSGPPAANPYVIQPLRDVDTTDTK